MGIFFLLLTVLVDSQFWNRVLWPEGEVFWFNTIMNKSSEWGTSPFLWYFYSALPRAMGFSMFLVPIGMWLEPRARVLAIPCFVFVLAFSCLPHKELRFIIYVFPFLNVAAAATCARFWINRSKSVWQYLLNVAGCGHLLGNVLVTLFLLLVAGTNYPGGVAMSRLHRLVDSGTMASNITVHIGNFAAQSGVSRFTEINGHWRYFKDDLTPDEIDDRAFSHLLVEAKSKHASELKFYQGSYNVMEFVECFDNIGIQYKSLLPVRIKTRPCIYILERKRPQDIIKREEKVVNVNTEGGKVVDIVVEEQIAKVEELKEKVINIVPEIDQSKEPENVESKEPEIVESKEPEIASQEPEDKIEVVVIDEPIITNDGEDLDDPELDQDVQKEIDVDIVEDEIVPPKPKRKNKLTSELVKEIIRKQKNDKNNKNRKKDQPKEKSNGSGAGGRPNLSKVVKGNRISNIKKVIKNNEIRHVAEEISKMDMSEFCDLDAMSTKECLRKVIDELQMSDEMET